MCFCGNSFGKYGTSTACTTPCTGLASQTCGGTNVNSVYPTLASYFSDLNRFYFSKKIFIINLIFNLN